MIKQNGGLQIPESCEDYGRVLSLPASYLEPVVVGFDDGRTLKLDSERFREGGTLGCEGKLLIKIGDLVLVKYSVTFETFFGAHAERLHAGSTGAK